MNLNGKAVVITGGTSGIGLATAKLFVSQGAKVLVTGRTPDTLAKAKAELGATAIVVASDTSKLSDIAALATKAKAELGAIDGLFINAGIAKFAPLQEVSEALWDEIFRINTKGAFFTLQKFAPILKDGAGVVLNTSVVDEKGMPNTSVYSASKAALRSLARTFAGELVGRNIRVNAVSPGPITTPIYQKLGMPADQLAAFANQMEQNVPLKRFGLDTEVAKAVAFLTFEATYTTGEELVVDGGLNRL